MKFSDKLELIKKGISLSDIRQLEEEEKAELESAQLKGDEDKKEDNPPADDHSEEGASHKNDEHKKDDTAQDKNDEPDYKALYEKASADLKQAQEYINRQPTGKKEEKSFDDLIRDIIS